MRPIIPAACNRVSMKILYLGGVNLYRMNKEQILQRFEELGIRPTAVRILVAQTLADADASLSLSQIETTLDTTPKSSIFRALILFLEHRMVHCFEDGSGSLKYELCGDGDDSRTSDMHTHFYCEKCRRTFCLKTTRVPLIELPEGFAMQSVNYMVKGLCRECNAAEV